MIIKRSYSTGNKRPPAVKNWLVGVDMAAKTDKGETTISFVQNGNGVILVLSAAEAQALAETIKAHHESRD